MSNTAFYQGKTINYSLQGLGKTLVFLHGYLEYKEIWANYITQFSNKYRILCIDLPGHGGSETIGATHTMSEMAKLVKFIMDKTETKEAIIIGHSMGGYIGLSFISQFPKQTKALVMFSSSALNDSTEKLLARNRDIEMVLNGKKDTLINNNIPNMFASKNLIKFKETIEKIKLQVSKMSEQGIISALEGMKTRINNADLIKTTNIPILFIAGKYDNLIQIDVSKRQVENSKNISFKVLENSGHMGYIEEEKLSAQYILDYLKIILRK